MSSTKYDDLSREELVRLLERREREPQRRFGLVWEQDDLERESALNADFVALEQDGALSCGDAPYRNLLIEGDDFDGILLVETKERVYDPAAEEKVDAEHKFYGRPLMLTLENGRFMSVRFNPQQRRNELDRVFSLDWAAGYE